MIKKMFFIFLLFTFTSMYAEPPFVLCGYVYKSEFLTTSAQYAEGTDAMYKFIYKSLSWDCGGGSYEGTIILNFKVDIVGCIWDIEVQQSVAPCLDEEVIKAVKAMPYWVPATIDGTNVCTEVSLPVRFRLGWEEQYERKK